MEFTIIVQYEGSETSKENFVENVSYFKEYDPRRWKNLFGNNTRLSVYHNVIKFNKNCFDHSYEDTFDYNDKDTIVGNKTIIDETIDMLLSFEKFQLSFFVEIYGKRPKKGECDYSNDHSHLSYSYVIIDSNKIIENEVF